LDVFTGNSKGGKYAVRSSKNEFFGYSKTIYFLYNPRDKKYIIEEVRFHVI